MRIVNADEMAAIDRTTIDRVGIPGVVLMENAGRGACEVMWRHFPDLAGKRVLVLAGGGNNGGDGFVIARHLWQRRVQVDVCCLRQPADYRGDARINLAILDNLGVPVEVMAGTTDIPQLRERLAAADLVVDAILGTGLNAPVSGVYRNVIELVNEVGRPVFAVDLPSGLDATTGLPLGVCIRATVTATFGLAKIGQLVTPGCSFVGCLEVVDICLPRSVTEMVEPPRLWLDLRELAPLVRTREMASHKGSFGHVLVVAGSVGKTGAGAMASMGAARAGAGLVTLAVPVSLHGFMEVKLTEVMTEPLAETAEQTIAEAAVPRLEELLQAKAALALGPGISTQEETRRVVLRLVQGSPCPVVVDADALTVLVAHLGVLKRARAPVILTPHPGEMGRLTGLSPAEVQGRRLELAHAFSREHGVVLVLKGARTLVASPEGRLAVNGSGNPSLASGGTGDVLTGLIAGFLAQGLAPFQAACLGVYCHGAAADRLAPRYGDRGLLASDLLPEIPSVLKALRDYSVPAESGRTETL
jgi:NAD(P)H-hydrate epimerase